MRASQSGDANRNAAPDVDQGFTVTANFGSWAQDKFTAAELLDPNISGPNAVYGLRRVAQLGEVCARPRTEAEYYHRAARRQRNRD